MNSAGSANKENAKALDSIQGKTQAFKSALEELANKTISSDFVKSLVDSGTAILKFANSDLGQATIAVTALTSAFYMLTSSGVISGIASLINQIQILSTNLAAFQAIGGAAILTSPLAAIAAAVAAIGGAALVVDALTTSTAELEEKAQNSAQAYADIKSEVSALSVRNDLTKAEQTRLNILKSQLEVRQKLAKGDAISALESKYNTKMTTRGGMIREGTRSEEAIKSYQDTQSEIDKVTNKMNALDVTTEKGTKQWDAYQSQLDSLNTKLAEEQGSLTDIYTALDDAKNSYGTLSPELETVYNNLVSLLNTKSQDTEITRSEIDGIDTLTQSMEDLDDETDDAASISDDFAKSIYNNKSAMQAVNDAVQDYNKYGLITQDTIDELNQNFLGLGDALIDTEGNLTDTGAAALSDTDSFLALIESMYGAGDSSDTLGGKLYTLSTSAGYSEQSIFNLLASMSSFNGASLDVSQKLAALAQLTIAAGNASSAINSVLGTYQANAGRVISGYVAQGMTKAQAEAKYYGSAYSEFTGNYDYSKYEQKAETTPKGSGGGGGSSSSKTDTQLENLKSIVSLRKSELSLMQERGDSDTKQISKIKEIQSALAAEADYMRKIGASQEDINELSTTWWSYSNKIKDIKQDEADAEEKALKEQQEAEEKAQEERLEAEKKFLKAKEDLIDDYIDSLKTKQDEISDYYDSEIDKIKETNDVIQDNIELQEAQEALARAKSQRKFVYKNGQFQYTEDIDAISAAQANLDKIKQQQDIANQIKTLEKAKDTKIDIINQEIKKWEEYKQFFEDLIDKLSDNNDELLDNEIDTKDLENDIFSDRLSNVASFVAKYNSILSQLGSGGGGGGGGGISSASSTSHIMSDISNVEGDSQESRLSKTSDIMRNYYGGGDEDKYKEYLQSTDFASLAANAKTLEEFQNYLEMREVKAKELGIMLGLAGTPSTQQLWDQYSGSKLTSWRDPDTGKEYTRTSAEYDEWYKIKYGSNPSKYGTSEIDAIVDNPSYTGYGTKNSVESAKVLLTLGKFVQADYEAGKYDDIIAQYNKEHGITNSGALLSSEEELKKKGYANGTTNSTAGLHMFGEKGAEIGVISSGSGVIPANMTSNLMQLGQYSPTQWFSQLKGESTSGITNGDTFNINTIELKDIDNPKELFTGIKNLAVQYSTQRK